MPKSCAPRVEASPEILAEIGRLAAAIKASNPQREAAAARIRPVAQDLLDALRSQFNEPFNSLAEALEFPGNPKVRTTTETKELRAQFDLLNGELRQIDEARKDAGEKLTALVSPLLKTRIAELDAARGALRERIVKAVQPFAEDEAEAVDIAGQFSAVARLRERSQALHERSLKTAEQFDVPARALLSDLTFPLPS